MSRTYFLIGLLVLLIFVLTLMSQDFLTVGNLLGITQFGAVLALVAIAQSLVITSGNGGIDLSIGSIVSLSGVVIGLLVTAGMNIWIASIFGVIAGGLLGAFNGLSISIIGLPPFIATLGTMYMYGSIALVLTGGAPISGFPESFGFLGQGTLLGLPTQILTIVIPVFLVISFIVYRTVFGRHIYLVGTNETAARFANISVKKTRFLIYTLSGLLAGMGSVIMCSWLMTARADVGDGLELQAITVAVLGGINILGGQGKLGGVMLAVLIVTFLSSGLQIANVNSIWQLAILGIILIGAVALNQYLNKKFTTGLKNK
jgi:ribose/xylose/arabinose/galactoside ABC-type transport system permease subunit